MFFTPVLHKAGLLLRSITVGYTGLKNLWVFKTDVSRIKDS